MQWSWKTNLKEGGGGGSKENTRTLQGESTLKAAEPQGSHHLPHLCQWAAGSGSSPHAPAHLSIRSRWPGGGTEVGSGWGKWRRAGQREGEPPGLRPQEVCAGAVAAKAGGGSNTAEWVVASSGFAKTVVPRAS
jgi:hypothetical protein